MYGIQMAKISYEQTEQKGFPDLEILGYAQHQGLVNAQEKVQVRQLRQHDGSAQGNRAYGCGADVSKLQIG